MTFIGSLLDFCEANLRIDQVLNSNYIAITYNILFIVYVIFTKVGLISCCYMYLQSLRYIYIDNL